MSTGGYTIYSGAGSVGTSYSGGTAGGASNVGTSDSSVDRAENGSINGGKGGNGNSHVGKNGAPANYAAGGGAGNPGGLTEKKTHVTETRAETGTGGLIIIYGNNVVNNKEILSEGKKGEAGSSENGKRPGGSSGGGSINIFYNSSISKENISANGGASISGHYNGIDVLSGTGGYGSITIGTISTGTFIKDE